MTDHANSKRPDRSPATQSPAGEANGLDDVESYEVEGGVVFYDPQNPLAWVETTRTITLKEYL
ncbi:hypothetical protein SAMN04487947_1113 [Halogeometricum rufum]|mgnify:CR=1 FL=1|jgi:hypothetical protein|uniref:Uncharacterized protein n=1 Tax=Halogeometricum rufum TaxID=553469 RepID=A0A1I6GGC7_9EURY|nr:MULTISPECIES: hypothetical protein [Halogeometricum]MUV58182.1 hypothetical protein [Halogeometricum sp. CBA1124]SFR41229.1 hypothetical protein SAMN04487947_1113 [Halogeometricum rufum]